MNVSLTFMYPGLTSIFEMFDNLFLVGKIDMVFLNFVWYDYVTFCVTETFKLVFIILEAGYPPDVKKSQICTQYYSFVN